MNLTEPLCESLSSMGSLQYVLLSISHEQLMLLIVVQILQYLGPGIRKNYEKL